MNRLVLAWLVARASSSAPSSSRSPRPWRSWRPSAVCRRKCHVSRLPTHQQPAHAPNSPMSRLADGSHAPGHQKNVPATSLGRWVLVNCSMVQNEQTGGTEAGRQGCRKEKCREALCSHLLLLSLLVVVPSSRWTCPEWCARKCWSKSFMIKFIFKSAASLRSMTPETRSEPNLDRKPQSGPMPSRLLTF